MEMVLLSSGVILVLMAAFDRPIHHPKRSADRKAAAMPQGDIDAPRS